MQPPLSSAQRGLGGVGLATIGGAIARKVAPNAYRQVQRQLTIPATVTYNSVVAPTPTRDGTVDNGFMSEEFVVGKIMSKAVPWLKFDGLVVGRNSNFHTETLTHEQLEDLGGTEYRALVLLSYLVPAVSVVFNMSSLQE